MFDVKSFCLVPDETDVKLIKKLRIIQLISVKWKQRNNTSAATVRLQKEKGAYSSFVIFVTRPVMTSICPRAVHSGPVADRLHKIPSRARHAGLSG